MIEAKWGVNWAEPQQSRDMHSSGGEADESPYCCSMSTRCLLLAHSTADCVFGVQCLLRHTAAKSSSVLLLCCAGKSMNRRDR